MNPAKVTIHSGSMHSQPTRNASASGSGCDEPIAPEPAEVKPQEAMP